LISILTSGSGHELLGDAWPLIIRGSSAGNSVVHRFRSRSNVFIIGTSLCLPPFLNVEAPGPCLVVTDEMLTW